MFAINSSRELHGSKIDDTLPESNKRTPVHEGPLMGLDRVVILLINSSDVSVAVAAGTPPRSPTKPWAGPPTGITAHTPVGDPSVWRPLWPLAGRLLEKNR